MICALTVRQLKPGTFDDFRRTFMEGADRDMPRSEKWIRFNMVRNTANPDEVICFGFFDGSVEELRESASEGGYAEQMERIAPFVESVGADGFFEVVEERTS